MKKLILIPSDLLERIYAETRFNL